LLVTNWSVHSESARQLITDLFKRQADDPRLTRGEALRQAMMALVDGSGYLGADGKTEFAYAHPLFWAPYSILGDGARANALNPRGARIKASGKARQRKLALILSSAAEPGQSTLASSVLSGVSTVLRWACKSSASGSK